MKNSHQHSWGLLYVHDSCLVMVMTGLSVSCTPIQIKCYWTYHSLWCWYKNATISKFAMKIIWRWTHVQQMCVWWWGYVPPHSDSHHKTNHARLQASGCSRTSQITTASHTQRNTNSTVSDNNMYRFPSVFSASLLSYFYCLATSWMNECIHLSLERAIWSCPPPISKRRLCSP